MHLFTWLLRLRQAACDPALLPGNEHVSHSQSGKLLALLDAGSKEHAELSRRLGEMGAKE